MPYANSSASFVGEDPDLPAVLVHQPDALRADLLVDPLVPLARDAAGRDPAGGGEVSKALHQALSFLLVKRHEPLHAAARHLVQPARLNPRESSPGGEEAMSSCLQARIVAPTRDRPLRRAREPSEQLVERDASTARRRARARRARRPTRGRRRRRRTAPSRARRRGSACRASRRARRPRRGSPRPRAARASAPAAARCPSPTGITRTCTGASQKGNAPP